MVSNSVPSAIIFVALVESRAFVFMYVSSKIFPHTVLKEVSSASHSLYELLMSVKMIALITTFVIVQSRTPSFWRIAHFLSLPMSVGSSVQARIYYRMHLRPSSACINADTIVGVPILITHLAHFVVVVSAWVMLSTIKPMCPFIGIDRNPFLVRHKFLRDPPNWNKPRCTIWLQSMRVYDLRGN